jgi:hypothetical protein
VSRSIRFYFAFAALCFFGGCSKNGGTSGGAGATQAATGSTSGSASSFVNGGGDACAKYLSPDIVAKIIGAPTRPAKKLSAQSCTVERTDDAGSITITLNAADAASFKAYQQYLPNPQPLAGVGDQAVQTMLGISSIKAPNMGCDIDAGGAPGSVKEDRATLGKELGDVCNRIYADAH